MQNSSVLVYVRRLVVPQLRKQAALAAAAEEAGQPARGAAEAVCALTSLFPLCACSSSHTSSRVMGGGKLTAGTQGCAVS
jgi:hypothetical protein